MTYHLTYIKNILITKLFVTARSVTIFYGSGYDFLKVTVPVLVPYLEGTVFQKNFEKNLAFLHSKLFLQGKN
jgi:hypothetical protein